MRETKYVKLHGSALQKFSEIACELKDQTGTDGEIKLILEQSLNESESIDDRLTALERTPNMLRTTGSGSIASVVYDVSIYNSGGADGTVLGSTIKAGEMVNFSAGTLNNYYSSGAFTYNATGTEFLIIYNS